VNDHRPYRGGRSLCPIALTLIAATCLVVLPAGGTAAAAQPPAEAASSMSAAPAVDRYTPLVQSVMSKPRWFTGTDGAFISPTS
jgi:hypothetical protein